jgi:GNAT superfamily N-acetyltransferase
VSVVVAPDLGSFAAAHPRLTEAYLRRQDALGCTRPEWRFAWVDATDAIRARAAFWALPGTDRPLLLDVVLGDDDEATAALLAAGLRQLAIGAIDYQVTRALGAGRGADEPAALEACGFALVATQTRLLHSGPPPADDARSGVELRAIAEVGYDALGPLVTAVRRATADRATGERADGDAEVASLRRIAHDPRWWTLAVETGRPVGYVLPVRTDGGPVIADIGVVPSARGRGIGRLLLAHGTAAVLGETGQVGADVDDPNAAMLAAASAVGFRAHAARAHLARTVTFA